MIDCVWMTLDNKEKSLHLQTSKGCDMVMKSSLARKTLDNITCVLLTFNSFESSYIKTPIHCDLNNIDQYYCQTDPSVSNAFSKYSRLSLRVELEKKGVAKRESSKLNTVNYQYLSKNLKKLKL